MFCALMFSTAGKCYGLNGVPDKVRTPSDLVGWYSKEFEYRMEMIDEHQTPEETIIKREGDCEDFAFLSRSVLVGLGIEDASVVRLKFKGLNICHAVCVFKDENGIYYMITNRELIRTDLKDMSAAIQSQYPDIENIKLIPGL